MTMNDKITLDENSVFERFSENSRRIILSSYDFARRDASNVEGKITVKHLFVAILLEKQNIAARLLEKLNIDLLKTADAIMGEIGLTYEHNNVVPDEQYRQILGESFVEAANLGHVYVGSEHILLAIMQLRDLPFIEDLKRAGLNYETIRNELLNFATYQPGVFRKESGDNEDEGVTNETGALANFGRNMVELARQNKYLPVFGRDSEVERMLQILSRQTKNNPILIGESGVGKTAIVEGLAQRIAAGQVPVMFKDTELIQLDISAIIAGAKIRGDVEERLLAIMEEVEKSPHKIIFIDEIHTIVSISNSPSGADIANLLKPYLTGGQLRIIGATTSDEYRRYFEDDGAMARRFQPVPVEELDIASSIKVLQFLRPQFEEHHKVTITDEALEAAVKLSERYIIDRYLPDKAIDLIDEAAAKQKLKRDEKDLASANIRASIESVASRKGEALDQGDLNLAGKLRLQEVSLRQNLAEVETRRARKSTRFKVEPEDLKDIISQWTKIPVSALTATDLKVVAAIQKKLADKIIGQKDAIEKVSAALQRAKLGLSDAIRPQASFLFLGPTGVGKTETAKIIARELFGSDNHLIQANMSEYMEAHSVAKIIGAPPGYIGYQDGKHLSEQIRQNPYSVILFDEIEKANSDVLNILLQMLDEGEIMDSKGRVVSFRNAVVILTSNIGAEEIADDNVLGFDVNFNRKREETREAAYQQMREQIMNELKNYLRPELINRLDEVIVFRGLNEDDAEAIAKLQVREFAGRLEEKYIALKVQPNIVTKIAEDGFSKEYGARNIRRKVQELLENNLAQFLLEHNLIEELSKRQKKKEPRLLVDVKLKDEKIEFNGR